MARAWKTFLICPRCGGPLQHKSSVQDETGRWYCGVACRRKQLRHERKQIRRQRGNPPIGRVNLPCRSR